MRYFFKNKNEIDIIYIVGLILAGLLVITFVLLKATNFKSFLFDGTPDCFFERLTGIFCPGCGLTRASVSFFEGKFLKSFLYNAIVPYAALAYLYLMIRQTLHYLIGTKPSTVRLLLNLIYIGAGILVVQWIVKVVLLLVFHIRVL